MLVNAVYLKVDWQTAFARDPMTDATFTRADGTMAAVPMRHQLSRVARASARTIQPAAS